MKNSTKMGVLGGAPKMSPLIVVVVPSRVAVASSWGAGSPPLAPAPSTMPLPPLSRISFATIRFPEPLDTCTPMPPVEAIRLNGPIALPEPPLTRMPAPRLVGVAPIRVTPT